MKRSESFNALLSLNIGFAIVSRFFIYDHAYHLADAPKIARECPEAFSRMLFHIAPLGFHWHTKSELRRNAAIREAVFLGLTFAVALFLYPLTKLAMPTDPRKVNVNVSSSSMGPHGTQLLDVVIDGKKYELQSELAIGRLLALGDYKAKLVTNRKTADESLQVYEFLFPDKTRQYDVVGQTE